MGVMEDCEDMEIMEVSNPFGTGLQPRKKARTAAEKEQRRVERIMRNRRAAQKSRERKRVLFDALQIEHEEIKSKLSSLESLVEHLRQENSILRQENLLLRDRNDLESESMSFSDSASSLSTDAAAKLTTDASNLPALAALPATNESTTPLTGQMMMATETPVDNTISMHQPERLVNDLQCLLMEMRAFQRNRHRLNIGNHHSHLSMISNSCPLSPSVQKLPLSKRMVQKQRKALVTICCGLLLMQHFHLLHLHIMRLMRLNQDSPVVFLELQTNPLKQHQYLKIFLTLTRFLKPLQRQTPSPRSMTSGADDAHIGVNPATLRAHGSGVLQETKPGVYKNTSNINVAQTVQGSANWEEWMACFHKYSRVNCKGNLV